MSAIFSPSSSGVRANEIGGSIAVEGATWGGGRRCPWKTNYLNRTYFALIYFIFHNDFLRIQENTWKISINRSITEKNHSANWYSMSLTPSSPHKHINTHACVQKRWEGASLGVHWLSFRRGSNKVTWRRHTNSQSRFRLPRCPPGAASATSSGRVMTAFAAHQPNKSPSDANSALPLSII